jgi:hypothetical protein
MSIMSRRVALPVIVGLAVVGVAILIAWANRDPRCTHLCGTHPTRGGPIVYVKIEPVPEGPIAPSFVLDPGPDQLSIRMIRRFIPRPLPEPLDQGLNCEFGGNLTIEFEAGARLVYGPCHRPESIDRLWTEMVRVITDGACEPVCGPGRPT